MYKIDITSMKKTSITQTISVVAIFAVIASATLINHARAAIIPFKLPDSFLQNTNKENNQNSNQNNNNQNNQNSNSKNSSNDSNNSNPQSNKSYSSPKPLETDNSNTPTTPIVVEKTAPAASVTVTPTDKQKATKNISVTPPAATPKVAVTAAPEFTSLLVAPPASSYGYSANGLNPSAKNKLYMLGLAMGLSGLALALYEKITSTVAANNFNTNF
ncbi:MAG: hypothetical protein JWO40_879 [Candidatus Doudnabacteria bacterium]|nr:hypothetical protein [Candidatus Doudnabacteria bacterium]